jgi:hypothetical protein
LKNRNKQEKYKYQTFEKTLCFLSNTISMSDDVTSGAGTQSLAPLLSGVRVA